MNTSMGSLRAGLPGLRTELARLRRLHYTAANPSEATSRRETHPTDMEKRQTRVRELNRRIDAVVWDIREIERP